MKKLIIVSAAAISGLFFNTANAQIRVHFGLNFEPARVVYRPAPAVVDEAPVYEQNTVGYDNSDDYYYLPDVGAYYDVNAGCYYYNDGANWVSAAYLPGAYRNYDWRNARRFELRANRPYLHDDFYRNRYEGREHGDWNRNSYGRIDGGYRQPEYSRGYGEHFENRDFNRHDDHFDNRSRGFDQRYENRAQGNEQHFDDRRQNGQQPSYQNNNRERDNRSDGQRFTQVNPRGGFQNRRMEKF